MNKAIPRALGAAIALAFAAALPVQAQTSSMGTDPNTGGRPAQSSVSEPTGKTPAVVERAENSRPAQATKRVARKGTNVAKKAGHKTANAMRSTGDKISSKLPKGGENNTGSAEAGTSTSASGASR